MMLSKRERMLAIATAVVVTALVVNELVVKRVGARLEQVESHKQQLLAELNEAQSLLERRRLLERKWRMMLSDGLRSGAEAESRVARALDEWAGATRLTLTSLKPERVAGDKGLKEISFTVAGRGSLNAVAGFLYRVETAELPVKVRRMGLGLASESTDNMSLELVVSALYLGDAGQPSADPPPTQQQEVNDEEPSLL